MNSWSRNRMQSKMRSLVSLFLPVAACSLEIGSCCLLFLLAAPSSGFLVRGSTCGKAYFYCVFQLFYSTVFFVHYLFKFLVFADFLEFFLLRYLLPNLLFILFAVHKGLDLVMCHLQNPLNDIRGGSNDVFNVILANLIIKFF